MKQEQKILLELIQSALGDQTTPESAAKLSEEERLKVMHYAKQQELFPFLQYFDCFAQGKCRSYFFQTFLSRISADNRQEREKEVLLEALEQNGIDCIPLKGIVTKTMYPLAELRTMGDLDILYKIEQTESLKTVMEKLGYEYEGEASKHDHYRKPGVVVEMHKELLPVGSVACPYFENLWERTEKEEGKTYLRKMSLEDHYIFTLCHLLEHFIRGGIGIRMVLDIYILSHQPGWNKKYISEQLKGMGLDEFEEQIRILSEIWFGEKSEAHRELEEKYADLATYIIEGGVFGNLENEKQNNALRYGSRFTYLRKCFFPSYQVMKSVFSWLNTPLLLPAAWFCRFWNVWTKRRKNVSRQFQAAFRMEEQSAKGVMQREELFEKYGLREIVCSKR